MVRILIIGKLSNFRTASRLTGPSGFTLLELIIVSALIGIMLVISVPTLHNTFIDDRLKATSRKIIGLINGVRELAVREQQSYFLSIDKNENRIWYEKDMELEATESTEDTEETEDKSEFNIPDEVRISEIWTKSEGEYSDDQNRIWISRKGYMDQTVLHLRDDDDNVISLHFSPFFGSVTIYDEYTQAQ
jgi:prepilin-type N-terminal cleavage/methylation domain-containing protein